MAVTVLPTLQDLGKTQAACDVIAEVSNQLRRQLEAFEVYAAPAASDT